jgi:hypothetical protein
MQTLFVCAEYYKWKDPYDGNSDLKHVNHYPPKVSSSECVPILVSEKTNLRMSDTTIDDKTPIDFQPMIVYYNNCKKDMESGKVSIPLSIMKYMKDIK